MSEPKDGCVSPAKGPIYSNQSENSQPAANTTRPAPIARTGKPAPDFQASAFVEGGFRNIKLSDYSGKWVVLCFYPGDFTFV